jgi:AbrB family looped-hinge helix DNA binding protein
VEVARITTKGQITIPIEIRKKLNLKKGDKILFLEEENGRIYFENMALLAFNRIQKTVDAEQVEPLEGVESSLAEQSEPMQPDDRYVQKDYRKMPGLCFRRYFIGRKVMVMVVKGHIKK